MLRHILGRLVLYLIATPNFNLLLSQYTSTLIPRLSVCHHRGVCMRRSTSSRVIHGRQEFLYVVQSSSCLALQSSNTSDNLHSQLLVTVDPASFDDPLKNIQKDRQGGHPFPIAWFREAQREGPLAGTGRVWYSSLGHATVLWQDPTFLKHIKGGIDWAIGKDAMTPV